MKKLKKIKKNLGFFYKLLNRYLLIFNKKGKFFNLKIIIYYFFFLKLKGFNFKFFFMKNLNYNTLYIGYGYTEKKLRYPRTFKIPIRINKSQQLTISLRLFTIYSLYKLNILLMYLNKKDYWNDLIIDYQEKIGEDKYYII